MTQKELTVILRNIRNARDTIEELANENYPYTEFCDKDLSDMHLKLNIMCTKICDKIDKLEKMEGQNYDQRITAQSNKKIQAKSQEDRP